MPRGSYRPTRNRRARDPMGIIETPMACAVRCVLDAGFGNSWAIIYTNCNCTLNEAPAWAIGGGTLISAVQYGPTAFKCQFDQDISGSPTATFPELGAASGNPGAIDFGPNTTWFQTTLVPEAF